MKPNVNSAVKCIAVANNKICLAKFKKQNNKRAWKLLTRSLGKVKERK